MFGDHPLGLFNRGGDGAVGMLRILRHEQHLAHAWPLCLRQQPLLNRGLTIAHRQFDRHVEPLLQSLLYPTADDHQR